MAFTWSSCSADGRKYSTKPKGRMCKSLFTYTRKPFCYSNSCCVTVLCGTMQRRGVSSYFVYIVWGMVKSCSWRWGRVAVIGVYSCSREGWGEGDDCLSSLTVVSSSLCLSALLFPFDSSFLGRSYYWFCRVLQHPRLSVCCTAILRCSMYTVISGL